MIILIKIILSIIFNLLLIPLFMIVEFFEQFEEKEIFVMFILTITFIIVLSEYIK